MPQFVARCCALGGASFLTSMLTFMLIGMLSGSVFAADKTELEEKLAEAIRLLEADKASHEETAEKKRLIDERLAARQQREEEIRQEMEALCEEQEKLSPGTKSDCLAKLNN